MTSVATVINAEAVELACQEAQLEARAAARDFFEKHGDRDACGFAWVNVYKVRSNSKLGKALVKVGFSKSYEGGLQLWNPSGSFTQCITAKEEGARAYASELRKYGIEAYAGSRMD
jgi:hypothetical protein